ncbi:MAG TPA: hypothetical protein VFA66_04880 [Gaiellaceae bacterium]|nr:hypothetical protein [Gaiellaceae bacterium]
MPDHDPLDVAAEALTEARMRSFRLGRTPRETALVEDIKQLMREYILAEVRGDLHELVRYLDGVEGVIPDVDALIDQTLADADEAGS